jgi:hypothetical protein
MPALGIPGDIPRDAHLTRFQIYLGLCDALACSTHLESVHLKELGDSFGHDILNVAALAGRLLWYEGVTPEIWRSHDLISVSVDVEAYYTMLQCACDIMADVICTLGAKKGQAPSDSFHGLCEWAIKNPSRLLPEYRIVARKLPWFSKINSMRTKLIHRGGHVNVLTDRVSFNEGHLISSLSELTHSMLQFSEKLATIVTPESARMENPKKRVIDGVYVPALSHLLYDYVVPTRSDHLVYAAQCLLTCGGYVEAAYLGYPNGFWWLVLTKAAQLLGTAPAVSNVPVNISGRVHNCSFVFSVGGERHGLIFFEAGHNNSEWLEAAVRICLQLRRFYSTKAIILLVNRFTGKIPTTLPKRIFLVIEQDSAKAARRIAVSFGIKR